jgi:uncharacterized membrane protein YfhO
LSRVTVPPKLVAVSSDAASRSQLSTLDPARQALAPASLAALHQDQQATAQVVDYSGSSYRIHYRSSTETLLRISAAFFPGWRARVDGQAREVHPIDHALMGVVVPPGERDLTLEYHSTYFAAGVVGSLLTLLACVAAIATQPRFRGFVRPAHEPRNQPL